MDVGFSVQLFNIFIYFFIYIINNFKMNKKIDLDIPYRKLFDAYRL